MRARVSAWLLLAALCTPGSGWAQTTHIQGFGTGDLAIVTPPGATAPTPGNALKVDGSAVTQPVSILSNSAGPQDLSTGAAYFGGQTGTIGAGTTIPAVTLFTAGGLAGLKSSGASVLPYSSGDGGATWTAGPALTGISAGANPTFLVRTTSSTPRYVAAIATTGPAAIVASGSSLSGAWTQSTGLPAGPFGVVGLAVQGATVLAVSSNTGSTATQACLSTNDGQAFGSCVTVDPAAGSIPVSSNPQLVASPAPSTWLVILPSGKIWRSTNNAATWTTVFTGSGAGVITCLTSTRCVAMQAGGVALFSTDAGVTWATSTTLASTSTGATLCPYTATTVAAVFTNGWPVTNGATTSGIAAKSTNGGLTWVPVPVTVSQNIPSTVAAVAGPCTVSGTQTSFVMSSAGVGYTFFGSTTGAGNAVVQSATRADACTLGVTATGAAAAGVTATLPAVTGAAHYLCLLEIRQYATAALTGGATPVVVTSTNLAGANAWTFQTALAVGTSEVQSYTPTTPIKTAAQGVATTIVAPATTSVIWRINVYYYAAP